MAKDVLGRDPFAQPKGDMKSPLLSEGSAVKGSRKQKTRKAGLIESTKPAVQARRPAGRPMEKAAAKKRRTGTKKKAESASATPEVSADRVKMAPVMVEVDEPASTTVPGDGTPDSVAGVAPDRGPGWTSGEPAPMMGVIDEPRQFLTPGYYLRKLSRATLWHRSLEVDEFGQDASFETFLDPLFEFLYTKYWRVEATGLENIPDKGRALLVANHSGVLPYDGMMIKLAVKKNHPVHRVVRPLVEDFIYHFPFIGAFTSRVGAVRACQENAERLLTKEELVAVFPEGIKGNLKFYRQRYQLQRFGRGGFIRLCMHTHSPIIPVAVVGAEEIHPIIAKADWLGKAVGLPTVPITPTFPGFGPLGLIPLPSKWHIHFGKPINIGTYGPEAMEDMILVNRLTQKIREVIQEMIKDNLKKRRSPFFG
ncbi:lysophospholipid acyltransferase family protein [Thermodesulfobacteriota bacterium]